MRRRALTIGINDYPGTGNDLAGCVNDANDWASALSLRGYVVETLLDRDATKRNVLQVVAGWAATLRRGDRAFLTYSGHGTWVPDRNNDEADLRDEALCLYDFQNGGLLVDDELLALSHTLRPGVRLTIVSDSCHSGTVSRFTGLPLTGEGRARFMSPDHFLDGADLTWARNVEGAPVRGLPRPGAILLSGCKDSEFSYDAWFSGRPNGAFSRHALDTLAQPGKRQSYAAWHRATRLRLPSAAYPQTPQLGATLWQRYVRAVD